MRAARQDLLVSDEPSSLDELGHLVGGVAGKQEPVAGLHLVGESHERQGVTAEGCGREGSDTDTSEDSEWTAPSHTGTRPCYGLRQERKLAGRRPLRADWGSPDTDATAGALHLCPDVSETERQGGGHGECRPPSCPLELLTIPHPKDMPRNPRNSFRVKYQGFK